MTAKPARVAFVALTIGLLTAGGTASARQSATPSVKPKLAHATPHSAKTARNKDGDLPSSASMSDPARLAIQGDLVWLGGFSELSAEEFDKHTTDAIKAFQRRNNDKDTGVLTDQERALLAQAAQAPQAAVGWRLIDDTATGARLGVPEKLVPQMGAARLGSRWISGHGQIQIETFRLHEASLPALFEQEKTASKRATDYSALSADSFIIAGQQKLKKFVERAQSRGSEIRGVTILYDQATEGTMATIAVAIADTFDGFPDPTEMLPAGPRRGVDYSSALIVSSRGDLVALSDVTDNCQAITVPGLGHAERIAEDRANNLALLRLYGARDLVAAAIGDSTGAALPPSPPAALTLYGVADQPAQGPTVSSTPAQLTTQGIDPAPRPGFTGATAVDAQNRFAGLVAFKAPLVAGIGPVALQADLVPADTVRGFLQAQGIAPATGQTAIDQSVVRVICVRK